MSDWKKDNFPRQRARLPLDEQARPDGDRGAANGRGFPDGNHRATRSHPADRSDADGGDAAVDSVESGRRARSVPSMPKTRPETKVRSPGITLAGTLLIVGLTVLAFAGGRLFGQVEEPAMEAQTEIAAATVAAPELARTEPEPPPIDETPIPLPAAFARAPVVCLDPGHGGEDRGFTRFFANDVPAMEEAILVLEHAWDLEARLQFRGYSVVMTRETDAAVNVDGKDVNGDGRTAAHDAPRSDRNKNLDDLQARINLCNDADADLLVSMHVNGYSTGSPRGFETWFTRERDFGDRNAVFATLAYAHLKEQLAAIGYVLPAEEERGVLPDTTADVQMDHSLFRHFIMTGPEVPGVVTASKMPGAIVEALFVSNDGDATVLSMPDGRNAIVTAYENAIVEFFERYPPAAQ